MGRGPDDVLRERGGAAVDEILAAATETPPNGKRPRLALVAGQGQEEPAPAIFPCSDLGNAERLAAHRGDRLRYCPAWGTWLAWDGQRWRPDDTGEAVRLACDVVRMIVREAEHVDAERRKALYRWAASSESAGRIAAMLKLCESRPGIPIAHAALDRDPWLLNVANGTIDMRTGELRAHRQEDLITKLVPVAYDPAAQCPQWVATIEMCMGGSPDMIRFLQRAFGYALTGLVGEQALFFFFGGGANGKSTLLELIMWLLGDYARAGAPDLLIEKRGGEAHPTELADLCGARFVVCQEAGAGRRWDEALVKRLTGGDAIKARRMHQDFWSFDPTHKLFIAANHRPTVRGADHAIWRRIKLVPFNVTIPESDRDPRLPEKLRQEASGILAWAVQGAAAWNREGLGAPGAVKEATEGYRAEQDFLGAFLADRCQVFPQARVTRGALRRAYEAWCKDNGEEPVSARTLVNMLRERGFIEGSVREPGALPERGWIGIRVVDR